MICDCNRLRFEFICFAGCKSGAKMLSSATVTLGCKAFLDAQAKSCYCGGPANGDTKNSNQKDNSNNKNNNKNNKQRHNDKPSGGNNNNNYNTYPNNIRQEQRQQREEPPSYGWKDKRDL